MYLLLILDKTFSECLESETSEIFVEESPAKTSDEIHGEGGEEHHEVRAWVPGVDVGHPHDHQGPNTERDKSGGETKVIMFDVYVNIKCNRNFKKCIMVEVKRKNIANREFFTPKKVAKLCFMFNHLYLIILLCT